ncbi:MAG: HPr family phosphocarrier protein [Paenibacillaceae bacterium]|jgi:catabolite repression HPr-like protein|nr:HPr family phosphocarrier protein [Paenibacillaceae bacterium]
MQQQSVVVQLRTGLHARPAAMFVQTANKYAAEVFVEKTGMTVNAKSIMGIMSLAINSGSTITIQAKGTDAADAIRALVAFVSKDELES